MAEVNFENPVFNGFLYYSAILAAKVLLMVPFTVRARFNKKVFENPEDKVIIKKLFKMDSVYTYDDEDVELVKRAHWNDTENIPMFLFVGIAYVISNPAPTVALNVFKAYTWSRIIYSIANVASLPRSTRDTACMVGYLLTFYMVVVSGVKFFILTYL